MAAIGEISMTLDSQSTLLPIYPLYVGTTQPRSWAYPVLVDIPDESG
jgi:hypothetical protein